MEIDEDDKSAGVLRVCMNIRCHVVTYNPVAYPNKTDQACPGCGRIGSRQPR